MFYDKPFSEKFFLGGKGEEGRVLFAGQITWQSPIRKTIHTFMIYFTWFIDFFLPNKNCFCGAIFITLFEYFPFFSRDFADMEKGLKGRIYWGVCYRDPLLFHPVFFLFCSIISLFSHLIITKLIFSCLIQFFLFSFYFCESHGLGL